MVKHIRFFLLLIIILIKSTFSHGQKIQQYNSVIKVADKRYLAKYDYYLQGKDTIYNGNFELSQKFENQEDTYEYLAINGQFNKGKANHKWVLTEGEFEPTGDGFYKGYTYSYQVNGHEFRAEGTYDNGDKTGLWKLYDWQIRNSEITDTTLIGSITYEKDRAEGKFQLRIKNDLLEGELGDLELTKGSWSFYIAGDDQSRNLVKEWIFKENTLVSMLLHRQGEIQEIKIENPAVDNISDETIPLDDDFLEIIELKARIFNEELLLKYKAEDDISNLYFTLLDNLELVDIIFSPITKSNLKPAISTKLKAAAIEERETELMDAVKIQNEINQKSVRSILGNPQINIASVSTNKVAEFKNVLELINHNFLKPTAEIISLYEHDKLKYFERNKLIQFKIKLHNETAIQDVFKNDSLSNNYQFQTDLSAMKLGNSKLEKLLTLAQALEKELALIKKNLQAYLNEIQKEEKLVALEAAMLLKYDKTKDLADSLITGEHDNFAEIDVAKAIIDFADSELAIYSNLPSIEEKMSSIEALINCFSRAEDLIYTIHKAPETIYKINEAYTSEVFNPYTFTNMEEKSKPPIYKAFNKLLLPGIFQNMQKLNCDNMLDFQANFEILYHEMMEVLNEGNTNRMERKVKRAKTAEKAAEILEMNLSF